MDRAQLGLWVMMVGDVALTPEPWPTASSYLTVLSIYFQCCQSFSRAFNQSWQGPESIAEETGPRGPLGC